MAMIHSRRAEKLVQSGIARGSRADIGRITASLTQAIADGVWRAGDRLPAERRLAELHGCARGTLRTALDRLNREGLVARRPGSGTYVTAGDERVMDAADITSPAQLLEARYLFEPTLVRLAVRAATPRDIERLDEALSVLERCGDDIDRFAEGDLAFHERLAEATRNPLLIDLYRRLNRVRGHAHWREIQRQTLSPRRIADYHRQHRALLAAVALRDADRAEHLIRSHLDAAERDLLSRRKV
jgi:DNA-binding FadR family transcriptional regulator